MATSSKEFGFDELLDALRSNLRTMEKEDIALLVADLVYIRHCLMAISMKDTLLPEELEGILEDLHSEFMKKTTTVNEVSTYERVQ